MISAVLLAAGRSQRMGQPKLLLPWGSVPMVRHMAQIVLSAGVDELVVVLGHRAAHVEAALAELPLRLVRNAAFLDGQSTSLRTGIEAVSLAANAVLVVLADQPLLKPQTMTNLIAEYERTHAPIIAPMYEGRRGNPVLFDRTLFAELCAIQGDQGARSVIQAHEAQMLLVDVVDEGVLLDVDTPDMFARVAALSEQNTS